MQESKIMLHYYLCVYVFESYTVTVSIVAN